LKKITKIYVAAMVLLVMLSNISYAVTYSICGMSSMSHCSCGMNEDNSSTTTKELSVKKVSCCSEEVNSISNNADFNKEQERVKYSDIVQVVYILTETNNLSIDISPKTNLLFYIPKRDIPVQYSRLII
jgi:hypothetical protein